ncbi:MAG: hypothetical protein GX633_08425, partial [Clostridiales bacterium]|nr:hypothetical protein [Clostridiales bacterium]
MKKYRVLALILAAFMIIAMFAGCQKKTVDSSSSSSATTEKKEEKKAEEKKTEEKKTEEKKEEKKEETKPDSSDTAEMRQMTYASVSQYQTEPVNWYETDVWKHIQEQANVEIVYQYLDGDKYNLMLASRDLADLMFGTDSSKLKDITETGLALDLLPHIDEKIPNLRNDLYKAAIDILVATVGKGESLYFLPENVGMELPRGGTDVGRGYNFRWDYYKEIGAPEVNNDDDYVAALKKAVELHPETPDGKKVYGIGLIDSLGNWSNHAVFTTAMCNPWTFSNYQLFQSVRDPSELINGYTDVEKGPFWISMRFYNKAYKEGILDPDSFTQTSDEFNTKVKAGQYVATANWVAGGLYSEMRASDPNTLAGIIRIPSKGHFAFANNANPSGFFPSYTIFVSGMTDNTDAVFDFLNVIYDLDIQRIMDIGFEGDTWEYINGVPTLKQSYLDMIAAGDPKLAEIGIGVGANLNVLQSSEIHTDGYLIDLKDTDEMRIASMNPLQKDFA